MLSWGHRAVVDGVQGWQGWVLLGDDTPHRSLELRRGSAPAGQKGTRVPRRKSSPGPQGESCSEGLYSVDCPVSLESKKGRKRDSLVPYKPENKHLNYEPVGETSDPNL